MSRSQQNESLTTYINYSTALTGVFVMIIIVIILKGRRKIVLANRIPGPRGSFIAGNLQIFIEGPEFVLRNILKEYRKHENSIFKLWITNRLYIMLTKPEHIEMVLTDRTFFKKSKEYDIMQESILGQGLITINDEKKWKKNRQIITKGMNFTLLKSFIPIMSEEANYLAEILQEKRNRKTKECDVFGPISLATMEIIGRTSMGVTFNAQRGGKNVFVENLHRLMQVLEYRWTHPWYLNKTLYRFSSVKRQHDQSKTIIDNFVDEIIKLKTIESNQNERAYEMKTTTKIEDSDQKIQTIIEILLQNTHGLSQKQIRDEIVTILSAGQDTTAMANTCVILMLALHQDIQDKAYEELLSIFPSDDDRHRPPTYEDLQRMKYLERVIKETLRLYPPVPIIPRKLDVETKIGDYLCPADTTLMMFPFGLHTSPLYYNNPNRFDPDNFLPEAVANRHPYTWIPFSAGMRNCIGIKFAMLQMKIIISTLLRKFRFSPSEKYPTPEHIRTMFLITLKFVEGCHVKFESRT